MFPEQQKRKAEQIGNADEENLHNFDLHRSVGILLRLSAVCGVEYQGTRRLLWQQSQPACVDHNRCGANLDVGDDSHSEGSW
jgi:hypothetical protein